MMLRATEYIKPIAAMPTRHNKKRKASRYSLKSVGFGYRMERTNWPLAVLNPTQEKHEKLKVFIVICNKID